MHSVMIKTIYRINMQVKMFHLMVMLICMLQFQAIDHSMAGAKILVGANQDAHVAKVWSTGGQIQPTISKVISQFQIDVIQLQ